jgi:hypothetical protein
MSIAPPLFRSTSWADVEEENPPSPQRGPILPPVPPPSWASDPPRAEDKPNVQRIEKRPNDRDQQGQYRRPQGQSRQSSQGNNSVQRNNPNEPRKLWEPRSDRENAPRDPRSKTAPTPDSQESWRRGEALPPVQRKSGERKPQRPDANSGASVKAGELEASSANKEASKPRKDAGGKKKPKAKKNSGEPKPLYELCLRPVPADITVDTIKSAFQADAVKKVKIVKDKAFLQFSDKESLDLAMKVKLPRWGDKDVKTSIPTPQAKSDQPRAGEKKAVLAEKPTAERKVEQKPHGEQVSKPVSLKKPLAEDPKKTNIFAAFDSDSDEDDDEDDEEDEDDEAEDE